MGDAGCITAPSRRGFCFIDSTGDPCPISQIDLYAFDQHDVEEAERFLQEATTKMKSMLVCQQVKKQLRDGITALQKNKTNKLGYVRKASIRLYSTHGLAYFSSSVPYRYKEPATFSDASDHHISEVFHACPFSVCINLCTWLSPTILRKLAVTGNLVSFMRWCQGPEVSLETIDIPEDAKDKAFSLFAETSVWPSFYSEWQTYIESTSNTGTLAINSPTKPRAKRAPSSSTSTTRKHLSRSKTSQAKSPKNFPKDAASYGTISRYPKRRHGSSQAPTGPDVAQYSEPPDIGLQNAIASTTWNFGVSDHAPQQLFHQQDSDLLFHQAQASYEHSHLVLGATTTTYQSQPNLDAQPSLTATGTLMDNVVHTADWGDSGCWPPLDKQSHSHHADGFFNDVEHAHPSSAPTAGTASRS